jgi:hypothetical protein
MFWKVNYEKDNDLSCMFFEGAIREDEYNKRKVS